MNIYQALANRGVKQAEIATQTGLAESTIYRAIEGKIQPLTASFKAILDRYGLTFTYSSSKVTIIDPWEGVTEDIADFIIDWTRDNADHEKTEYESDFDIVHEAGLAMVNFKVGYSVHTYTDGDGEREWDVSEIHSLELFELTVIAEDKNGNPIDIGANHEKITEIIRNWKS